MWQTILGTAIGVLAGWLITYLVAKRISHRSKLLFRIEQIAFLSPADFGGRNLQILFAGQAVTDVVVLSLTVKNNGSNDIVIPASTGPRNPNSILAPSFDFEELKLLAVKTLNNDQSKFYIGLAIANADTRLYVNISRLREGTAAHFQILATGLGQRRDVEARDVKFFPGSTPNVDVVTQGIIHRPWLTQQ
jgi:hypothetical protein